MEDNKLTLISDEGQEVECEIIFTYESEENGKNYVVYHEVGNEEEVMVGVYTEDAEGGVIEQIEDEKEFEMIEEIINNYFETEFEEE